MSFDRAGLPPLTRVIKTHFFMENYTMTMPKFLELLKQNAPYQYKKLILKHPDWLTEQTKTDDFIKGLEEDKLTTAGALPQSATESL